MPITLTRKSVVATIVPTAPGSGYSQALTTIAITGNATGHAVVDLAGTISAYVIDSPGDNYSTAPSVTVSGDGTAATAGTTITDGGLWVLRKQFIQDYYDAGPPVVTACPFNMVAGREFFTDATLQAFCDQVVLEEAALLLPYVQPGEMTAQSANAIDPVTALYKLIRIKAWQLMLTNAAYLKSIYSGGSTQDVVKTTIAQMEAQLKKDRIYVTRTNTFSAGSFDLLRG